MRFFASLLVLAACASCSPPNPPPVSPTTTTTIPVARGARDAGAAKLLAGHNDICRRGSRGNAEGADDVAECEPGLQCCYPCGMGGCDWVCHTPDECAVDMTRP